MDPDRQLCAVLKMETKQIGWTFGIGFTGIIRNFADTNPGNYEH